MTRTRVRLDLDSDVMALSHFMEFDSPITVHDDGTVSDGPADVYAPNLFDGELDDDRWELLDGYSGQDRHSGPEMHPSEFIGGRMAEDILATPGIYVAIAAYYPAEMEIPDDFPVRPLDDDDPAEDRATCGECHESWDDAIVTTYTPVPSGRCPFEAFHPAEHTTAEGWAVARLKPAERTLLDRSIDLRTALVEARDTGHYRPTLAADLIDWLDAVQPVLADRRA